MTPEEMQELLALKGWGTARLAEELGMTQAGVDRWFADKNGKRCPRGPAVILMRQWLEEARAKLAKKELAAK